MLAETTIYELLRQTRTIAVVGLSDDPTRPSHSVAQFLQRKGYRIIPVNPLLHEPILGEHPFATLRDIDTPIDLVDIFRRSEYVPQIVEDAITIGVKAVWMQLGVIHAEAAARATAAGLSVVTDRCIAIEHQRLFH